jgi:hypothetical protein
MAHPPALEALDRNRRERIAAPLRRSEPPRTTDAAREAELAAASCVGMFLCAALRADDAVPDRLATALFALGALDAAAARASLGRASRERLESELLKSLYGLGGREASAWKRALHRFERTRPGFQIRQQGIRAFEGWLEGEAPGARLAAVLGDA